MLLRASLALVVATVLAAGRCVSCPLLLERPPAQHDCCDPAGSPADHSSQDASACLEKQPAVGSAAKLIAPPAPAEPLGIRTVAAPQAPGPAGPNAVEPRPGARAPLLYLLHAALLI